MPPRHIEKFPFGLFDFFMRDIIDHHMPDSALPICKALVNPERLDASSEATTLESLAAVGLSFFVIMALNHALRAQNFHTLARPEPFLISLLDLVALELFVMSPRLGVNRL